MGSPGIDNTILKTCFDMKVSPYHSDLPGIEVYHNSNQCTEGNNIESRHRKPGTGGKRLCSHCKRIDG
jgi:hypothetical protein